jgi:hypothetical protein
VDEDIDTVVILVMTRREGRGRMEIGCKEDTIEVVLDKLANALGLKKVVVKCADKWVTDQC